MSSANTRKKHLIWLYLFHFNIRLVMIEVGDVVADVDWIVGIIVAAYGRLCHVLRHEVVTCLVWRLWWLLLLHCKWWIDKNLICFGWLLVGRCAVDEIGRMARRQLVRLVGNVSKVIVNAGSWDDFALMRNATSLQIQKYTFVNLEKLIQSFASN